MLSFETKVTNIEGECNSYFHGSYHGIIVDVYIALIPAITVPSSSTNRSLTRALFIPK